MIAFIKSLGGGGGGGRWDIFTLSNGCVYDCIREIGLLLSNETCFHTQITFTYRLPVLSHGSNGKRMQTTFNSICVRQSLLITHTMTAIFLIMTSNFIIADIVHNYDWVCKRESSNLLTLTIDNFWLERGIVLKYGQWSVPR